MMRGPNRGCLVAIFVALLVVGCVAYLAVRTLRGVENAYAVWNVSDYVIEHMETHDGAWPRNWEDLRIARQRYYDAPVSNEEMRHLRERVEVDFDVDPKELAKVPYEPGQADPPFRVIRHKRWPEMYYTEPNAAIWLYLNGKHRRNSNPSQPRSDGETGDPQTQ